MTKERLKTIKSITTWSGVLVTLSGIVLNLANGGSWQGNSLSLVGLLITCCGHWVTSALAKHQSAEHTADGRRFEELERRFKQSEKERESISDLLNKTGVFDRPESLRRIIHEQDSNYDMEHQDDGR